MDYETFKEQFQKDLQTELENRGGNMILSSHTVVKANISYDAVSVQPEDSSIGLNLNMNDLFRKLENGADYNDVVSMAADTALTGLSKSPELDLPTLTDYNVMREKLTMQAISTAENTELLATVPHTVMEDISIVYRFDLGGDQDHGSSILVTNDLLRTMDVEEAELKADAMEIAPENRPVEIIGMSEMLARLTGMEPDMFGAPSDTQEYMYVATTPNSIHGAGIIAYPDFMEQAAERIGGDFYLLPSSIHEVLLVPDDGTRTGAELQTMVAEINASVVDPEERLTDSAYHFDTKEHLFELAEKFEAREMAAARSSVIDELKNKQMEVSESGSSPQKAVKAAEKEAR